MTPTPEQILRRENDKLKKENQELKADLLATELALTEMIKRVTDG